MTTAAILFFPSHAHVSFSIFQSLSLKGLPARTKLLLTHVVVLAIASRLRLTGTLIPVLVSESAATFKHTSKYDSL